MPSGVRIKRHPLQDELFSSGSKNYSTSQYDWLLIHCLLALEFNAFPTTMSLHHASQVSPSLLHYRLPLLHGQPSHHLRGLVDLRIAGHPHLPHHLGHPDDHQCVSSVLWSTFGISIHNGVTTYLGLSTILPRMFIVVQSIFMRLCFANSSLSIAQRGWGQVLQGTQ